MKTFLQRIPCLLTTLLITILILFLMKDIIVNRNLNKKNTILSDILGKTQLEKFYMSQLVWLNMSEKNMLLPEKLYVYEMEDVEKQTPIDINSIIASGKKKLIIRYTEIGCNSCTDSTFKFIRKNKSLLNMYEILVLVDFTNYEYFLKWKKISEMNEKVLWLKKGSLSFALEKENISYIFLVGNDKKVSSIFIPNSNFPSYLKNYLNNL
jgi:hypothetical protein